MLQSKNKNYKKVLSLNIILITVIITSIILIGWKMTSLAAPEGSAPETFLGYSVNNETEYIGYTYFAQNFYNKDHTIPAYCLQARSGGVATQPIGGYTMTKAGALSSGYTAIIQNGWPAKNLTGDAKLDYYLTQVAIWWFQDRINGISDSESGDLTGNMKTTHIPNSSYNSIITNLLNIGLTANNATTNNSINIQIPNTKMTYENGYFQSELISASTSGNISQYEVSLSGANGAYVVDESGNQKTTFTGNQKFRVRINQENVNSSNLNVTVKVTGSFTEKITFRYTPPAGGNVQPAVPAVFYDKITNKASNSLNLEIEATRVGIAKKDSKTNQYVKGATLEIRKAGSTTAVKTIMSEANIVYVEDLEPGNYTLVETKAPNGYVKNKASVPFTVVAGSRDAVVTMNNDPTEIGIIKKDTDGVSLKGVVLQLLDSSGKKLDEWTTDGKVHSVKNLVVGQTYTVKETKTLDGYILNTTDKKFTVKDISGVQEVVVNNEYTKIEVSKVDESTKKLIKGAILVIKDMDGNEKYRITTEDKPTVITKIPVGTYSLEEVQAPEGYVLNKVPITFQVRPDGKVQRIVMKQNYTKITILGHNVTVDTALNGVTFQIENQKGTDKFSEKWTTSASNSSHTAKNLPLGKYILKEIKVPDGYILNEEGVEFEITGGDLEIFVPNDFTKVMISKRDIATEEELPGATLQIKNEKGKVVEEWISTEEEHLIERLPLGKYTLIETICPDGYESNTNEVKFEVTDDGQIQRVKFYNVPIVDIPDTVANISAIVYVLGAIIIAGGCGLIYVNTRKKSKK